MNGPGTIVRLRAAVARLKQMSSGSALGRELKRVGLLPDDCIRFEIDAAMSDVVTMHYTVQLTADKLTLLGQAMIDAMEHELRPIHIMLREGTLCGIPNMQNTWPAGHRWVPWRERKKATCTICAAGEG